MVSIKVNCALESDAIIVIVSVSFVLLCKCNLLAFILQVFTQKNTSHTVGNIKKENGVLFRRPFLPPQIRCDGCTTMWRRFVWPTVPPAAMWPFLLVDAVGTRVLRVRAKSADYRAYTFWTRRTRVPTRIANC